IRSFKIATRSARSSRISSESGACAPGGAADVRESDAMTSPAIKAAGPAERGRFVKMVGSFVYSEASGMGFQGNAVTVENAILVDPPRVSESVTSDWPVPVSHTEPAVSTTIRCSERTDTEVCLPLVRVHGACLRQMLSPKRWRSVNG